MKYLKTFNENKSNWSEFNCGDISNRFQSRGGYDTITPDESEKLKSYFSNLSRIDISSIEFDKHTVVYTKDRYDVVITKGADEWFYIMSDTTRPSTWYECDGIDGLIDCLKFINS